MRAFTGKSGLHGRQVHAGQIFTMLVGLIVGGLGQAVLADQDLQEIVIDDFTEMRGWRSFHEPPELDHDEHLQRHTVFTITQEWASRGSSSLKIEAPAFVPDQTTPWPGVVLRNTAIPMRDWREWKFLSVDIKVVHPDTRVLVLVQRGAKRHQRVSATHHVEPGEYRLWMNIPRYVSGGQIEDLANIRSIEILVYRPEEDKTIYVDNLRLTKTYQPASTWKHDVLGMPDAQWQVIEESLQIAPTHPPSISHVEPLERDTAALRELDSQRLRRVSDAAARLAAQAQAEARLVSDYAGLDHGAYIASADERVRFSGQRIEEHWERSLELIVGQGEVRSRQLILVRPYDKVVENITLTISDLTDADTGHVLPAATIQPELVGYLHLPENQRLAGFKPGWYPDPLMKWAGSIGLDEHRQVQPVLLTVRVPHDAPAGQYVGTITTASILDGQGQSTATLPVAIEVVSYRFPHTPTLRTLIATGPYGHNPELFLDYRISPNNNRLGSIYLRGNAPAVDLEQVESLIRNGLTTFNLHQAWELEIFRRRQEHSNEQLVQWFMSRLARLYPDRIWDDLDANGVASRAVVYGFDEVDLRYPANRETLRQVFQAVKDKYGPYGVKTATTAQFLEPEYLDLPVDIWIPILTAFDSSLAAEARRRGIEMWVYTIDWEIWRPLVWSRVLPWAAYQYRAEGWLYYNFSGWPHANERSLGNDPLTDWDPVSLASSGRYGTGGLVYQDSEGNPRGSLRLVNFREGMYDHDLLRAVKVLGETSFDEGVIEQAQLLLKQADSQLLLEFAKEYGGSHEAMSTSISVMLEQWRRSCLRLLAENN